MSHLVGRRRATQARSSALVIGTFAVVDTALARVSGEVSVLLCGS